MRAAENTHRTWTSANLPVEEHGREEYPHPPHSASGYLPARPRPAHLAKRILLAEDDRDLRTVMQVALEAQGYQVQTCIDGLDMLRALQDSRHFDLLITDLRMPFLTGGELALALSCRRPSLPIILISGALFPSDLAEAAAMKGWLFLSKPFGMPALLAAVDRRLDEGHKEPAALSRII